MKFKISIVMPVLNGERYLVEALESILAQTCNSYELVLVDDGSTDHTRELVHQFADRLDLKYVNHETCKGIAVSVNDGIRHASGEYIAFLDHDDLWVPNFLETQLRYLEEHPDVGMVHSDFQTIDAQGNIIEPSVQICRDRMRPSGNVFRNLFLDSFIAGSSVLIRKQCFDRLGGFDETLHWADYHMWLRIARNYNIDYVPKVLTKYRQHPGQSTRNFTSARPDDDSVALIAINKILELYPEARPELGERIIQHRIAMLYFDMAYSWLWAGAVSNARACLKRAIRRWPTKATYYILYGVSLLRPSDAKAARRLWSRVRALIYEPRHRAEIERRERETA